MTVSVVLAVVLTATGCADHSPERLAAVEAEAQATWDATIDALGIELRFSPGPDTADCPYGRQRYSTWDTPRFDLGESDDAVSATANAAENLWRARGLEVTVEHEANGIVVTGRAPGYVVSLHVFVSSWEATLSIETDCV